jgi:hypothetical protein
VRNGKRLVTRSITAACLVLVAVAEPRTAARAQRASNRLASIKQWTAEVTVTSDCEGASIDGSRTIIHNRIVTTYALTRRANSGSGLRWSGRASTTYQWTVGTESRGTRDIEESSGAFDTDGVLNLTDSTRISAGRPPGRPFTRKRYAGEALVDSSTYHDEPPSAELFDAPLPSAEGTLTGDRTEAAYSLLGGVVLSCPARRQWTVRAQ